MRHVRIYLAASAALGALCLGVPANAQEDDLWSGPYVGAAAGSSWSDVSVHTRARPGTGSTVIPPVDISGWEKTDSDSQNSTGFNGSLEAGYNWQAGSNWLFGVETDIGMLDVKHARTNTLQSSATPSNTATARQDIKTQWIWTLRPRLGYVSGPWLFYGTAGVTTSKIKYRVEYADTQTPPVTGQSTVSRNKVGWAAGLGAAYAFNPQWSVKGEWIYTDLGHVTAGLATTNGYAEFDWRAHMRSNLLRLGVDFRF